MVPLKIVTSPVKQNQILFSLNCPFLKSILKYADTMRRGDFTLYHQITNK
jgi:hypothetical protein